MVRYFSALILFLCPAAYGQEKSIEAELAEHAKLKAEVEAKQKQLSDSAERIKALLAELQRKANELGIDGKPPKPDELKTFVDSLKAAYAKEGDKSKFPALMSLWKAAASLASEAKTWGALWSAMADTAKALGLSGQLIEIQRAVSRELSSRLPVNPSEKPDEPITADHAKLIKAEFERVVKALEQVK
jgi:hypothetical protein